MTRVIIYSEYDLDRLYDHTLGYLHDKYHCQPSDLGSRRGDPNQFAFDAQARWEAEDWDGLMSAEQHRKR